MVKRILKFANIIAVILLLINWLALHDIARNSENVTNEWRFVTITYLIIIVVFIANIIFLSLSNKKKQKEEQ